MNQDEHQSTNSNSSSQHKVRAALAALTAAADALVSCADSAGWWLSDSDSDALAMVAGQLAVLCAKSNTGQKVSRTAIISLLDAATVLMSSSVEGLARNKDKDLKEAISGVKDVAQQVTSRRKVIQRLNTISVEESLCSESADVTNSPRRTKATDDAQKPLAESQPPPTASQTPAPTKPESQTTASSEVSSSSLSSQPGTPGNTAVLPVIQKPIGLRLATWAGAAIAVFLLPFLAVYAALALQDSTTTQVVSRNLRDLLQSPAQLVLSEGPADQVVFKVAGGKILSCEPRPSIQAAR